MNIACTLEHLTCFSLFLFLFLSFSFSLSFSFFFCFCLFFVSVNYSVPICPFICLSMINSIPKYVTFGQSRSLNISINFIKSLSLLKKRSWGELAKSLSSSRNNEDFLSPTPMATKWTPLSFKRCASCKAISRNVDGPSVIKTTTFLAHGRSVTWSPLNTWECGDKNLKYFILILRQKQFLFRLYKSISSI